MDNLLKQMRVRSSGAGRESKEEQGGGRDRRLAPQKSQPFKEKKTAQSWLRRQFSRQMSRGYESDNEIVHVTAVAAAVFAVHSTEESEIASREKDSKGPETSPTTKKNIKEDTHITAPSPVPEPGKPVIVSRRFSDEDVLKDTEGSGGEVAVNSEEEKERPEKAIGPSPSFRKTPTSSNRKSDSFSRKTRESAVERPPPRPPTPPIAKKPPAETKPVPTRPSGVKESKVDAWERAEMAKINERYKKVNDTISYWEKKKTDKAKRKLELSQGVGVDGRKMERAQKKYVEDIDFIKQIAGEARAKADASRRDDLLKVKQKADTLRTTGELPVTCFCC